MKWYVLFIESKPCDDVYEETHPDWVPTIFKSMNHSATNKSRYNRVQKRIAIKEKNNQNWNKLELLLFYKSTIIVSSRFQ
jgi:hypothetical protein